MYLWECTNFNFMKIEAHTESKEASFVFVPIHTCDDYLMNIGSELLGGVVPSTEAAFPLCMATAIQCRMIGVPLCLHRCGDQSCASFPKTPMVSMATGTKWCLAANSAYWPSSVHDNYVKGIHSYHSCRGNVSTILLNCSKEWQLCGLERAGTTITRICISS